MRSSGQGREAELVDVEARTMPASTSWSTSLSPRPFDVHGAAAGKVQQGLLALGRAEQAAGAAPVHLALFAHDGAAADRALAAAHVEVEGLSSVGRALLRHHAHHLGDHIARAAHDHGVAHAHILAAVLVLVVQRGVGDGAADEHRLQLGHRRELAGAADLHVDGQQARHLLLRRVLVGHGPARLAGDEAQALLQGPAFTL
jgi:hypothetical protein